MTTQTTSKLEAAAARQRKWRAANPEGSRAAVRRYREKNRQKLRDASRAKASEFRKNNPEEHRARNKRSLLNPDVKAKKTARDRDWRLRKNYGITLEQYKAMETSQGGLCAIDGCSNVIAHLDHCHSTGKIRGLLCRRCNLVLGQIKDSVALISALATYLTTNGKP